MKKLFAVLLSVLFVLGCVLPVMGAMSTPAVDAHLHFNSDGGFRVLNLSDFQDDATFSNLTANFVRKSVEKYQPDLIVLTGDNIAGYRCYSKSASEKAIRGVMDVLQELGVPVAPVFGNHDDEGKGLSKEEQAAVYADYSVSLLIDEAKYYPNDLSGVGTYYVPVYESAASNNVKFVLWMFDSGSDDAVEDADNYDHVHADQIAWYKAASAEFNANAGETVYGIAFQHIIVNEIYSAFDEAAANEKGAVPYLGKWYKLPATASADSYLGEAPCPSYGNEGEFQAFVETGNVLAVVCGHDHANSFVIPYEGVDIVCTPTCGFCSYGDTADRGGRVIDLDLSKPGTYSTYTYLFTDIDYNNTLFDIEYNVVAIFKQIYLWFNNLWVVLRETIGSIGK